MRPIREIAASEENFHLEQNGQFMVPRRDPVEPEPVGTIVLLPFRVTGYDLDCDGSLMACLDNIEIDGSQTGWSPRRIGLNGGFVVTSEELKLLGDPHKCEQR